MIYSCLTCKCLTLVKLGTSTNKAEGSPLSLLLLFGADHDIKMGMSWQALGYPPASLRDVHITCTSRDSVKRTWRHMIQVHYFTSTWECGRHARYPWECKIYIFNGILRLANYKINSEWVNYIYNRSRIINGIELQLRPKQSMDSYSENTRTKIPFIKRILV